MDRKQIAKKEQLWLRQFDFLYRKKGYAYGNEIRMIKIKGKHYTQHDFLTYKLNHYLTFLEKTSLWPSNCTYSTASSNWKHD